MTVLLTGAAGLIGRSLHERLPGLGWDVRAFDRVAVPDGIVGDVNSPDDLDAAMQGVNAVAHFAGHPREAPLAGRAGGQRRRDARRVRGRPPRRRAPRRARVVHPRRRLHTGPRRASRPTRRRARTPSTASARSSTRRSGATTPTGTACRSRACGSGRSPSARTIRARSRPGCRRATAPGWWTRACARRTSTTPSCGACRRTRHGILDLTSALALGYEPQDDAEDHAAALGEVSPRPVGRVRRRRVHLARVRHRRGAGPLAGPRMSSDLHDDLYDQVRAWIADDLDPSAAAELQTLLDAAAAVTPRPGPSWPTGSPVRSPSARRACAGRCAPVPAA